MNHLEIIFPGEVISKKNSRRCFGNKAVGSKAFLKYEKEMLQELQYRRYKWLGSYPIDLHCFFYRKTKRSFDFSNLLESVQDILVKAQVIEDDSYLHVWPVIDGYGFDKEHPRVVVNLKSR